MIIMILNIRFANAVCSESRCFVAADTVVDRCHLSQVRYVHCRRCAAWHIATVL